MRFKSHKQRKKVMSLLSRRLKKLGLPASEARKLPETIEPSVHIIGSSRLKYDRMHRALKPGKRVSKTGKVYYEHRRSHSDLHPAKHL